MATRLVVPSSNSAAQGNRPLYRVTNPSGLIQRPTLISGSSTHPVVTAGSLQDLANSGIHVIGANPSASSSLIRVHPGFVQPTQHQQQSQQPGGGLPSSASTGNIFSFSCFLFFLKLVFIFLHLYWGRNIIKSQPKI